MYRIKDIQKALLHLVGWRQAINPANDIGDEMTQSESGLYFQSAHPLCTLDNIKEIMPEEYLMKYPEWNLVTAYEAGQKVKINGFIWIARFDSLGEEPKFSDFNGDYSGDFGDPYWKPYNLLADYLEMLTTDGIVSAIQKFLRMKNLVKETKNLLENRTFFEGSGRIVNMVTPSSKIVGFEITPVRSMGVTSKIEKIGLQMAGATGEVRVYLFHSSKKDPVKVMDLNFTVQNGGFQWFSIKDLFLPYTGENISPGGSWYLCYDQNALPSGMYAVTFTKNWSTEPCGGCNMGNLDQWRELMKYVEVSPFMLPAPSTFATFPEIWDKDDMIYTVTQNYGMNVEVTVGCDLTDFIISQRLMFQDLIQKEVAAVALRTIALNPDVRVNRNQVNASREEILYELDGNTSGVKPGGLGFQIDQTIKSLRLDTQKIDKICLTCNNGGISFKTI